MNGTPAGGGTARSESFNQKNIINQKESNAILTRRLLGDKDEEESVRGIMKRG